MPPCPAFLSPDSVEFATDIVAETASYKFEVQYQVQPIPLPVRAWLFLSGIAGLICVSGLVLVVLTAVLHRHAILEDMTGLPQSGNEGGLALR